MSYTLRHHIKTAVSAALLLLGIGAGVASAEDVDEIPPNVPDLERHFRDNEREYLEKLKIDAEKVTRAVGVAALQAASLSSKKKEEEEEVNEEQPVKLNGIPYDPSLYPENPFDFRFNAINELPTQLQNLPLRRPLGLPVAPTQPRYSFVEPDPNSPGLAEDLAVPPENSAIFQTAEDFEPIPDDAQADAEQKADEQKVEEPPYTPLDVSDTLQLAEKALDKTGTVLTLQDLYRDIIMEHPDLELAVATILEKEGNILVSQALGNPRIGFDIMAGPVWTDYVDGTPSSLDWGSWSSYMTQTLFDFGAVRNNVIADTISKDSATLKVYATSFSVAMIITQYYLNVIQAQEVVQMRHNEVLFYKSLRDALWKRQKAGTGLMTDVQKIDVSLKSAESGLINEIQRLTTFRNMLSTLLRNKPVAWLSMEESLFTRNMNVSLYDLQEEGLKRNITLASIEKDIKATKYKIRSMEVDTMPKFGYKLSGGYQAEYPANSFYGGVQATVSWNIYDGGEHAGQIAKLRSTLYKQQATQKSETIAMIDRVKAAYNDYHVASKDLELAHNGKEISIDLTQKYLQEFDIGLRTLLDLVAAKQGEIEADLREINSRFRCVGGLMQLYNEVGLLDRYLPVPEGIVQSVAKRFNIQIEDPRTIIENNMFPEPTGETIDMSPVTPAWK